MLALLRATVDEDGRTLVMVTHDPVAAATTDHVVFIADGRVAGGLTDPVADEVAARMTALERDAGAPRAGAPHASAAALARGDRSGVRRFTRTAREA